MRIVVNMLSIITMIIISGEKRKIPMVQKQHSIQAKYDLLVNSFNY